MTKDKVDGANELIIKNALSMMVKIADMMECCESSKERKALSKDYRAYAKIVMPEAFKWKIIMVYSYE